MAKTSKGPANGAAPASQKAPASPSLVVLPGGSSAPSLTPTPSRGGPLAALDALISRPDAARLVRQLEVQPLFLLIKSLGLADAGPLLALCSSEQLQGFLDLDGWQRDRLAPARLSEWLRAILELPASKVAAHVRRLDAELLTSFLAGQARIYELTEGAETPPPPAEPEGVFYPTPDGFYLIDFLPDPDGDVERPELMRRFLEAIYRADLDLGRSVVQSACWDAGAETEEQAYRFRTGRMADLGFIEHYEALKLYAPVPESLTSPAPAAVPSSETTTAEHRPAPADAEPPGPVFELLAGPLGPWELFGSESGGELLLFQAARRLDAAEQSRLFSQLLVLANTVLAAELVEPGDSEATSAALLRTVATVSLGLEFRASSLRVAAAEVLREASPRTLFRIGYGLTQKLGKLAAIIVSRGFTTPRRQLGPGDDPASLLPEWLGEPLRGLLLRRPQLHERLDTSPPPTPRLRPFRRLADLGRAAKFLEELDGIGSFLTTGLGLRLESLPEVLGRAVPGPAEAKLEDLIGTMIANLLLERPPVVVPLVRSDLPALLAATKLDGRAAAAEAARRRALPELVVHHVEKALRERVRERSVSALEAEKLLFPPARRLIDEALAALGKGLTGLAASLADAAAGRAPSSDGDGDGDGDGSDGDDRDAALFDVVPRLSGLLLG